MTTCFTGSSRRHARRRSFSSRGFACLVPIRRPSERTRVFNQALFFWAAAILVLGFQTDRADARYCCYRSEENDHNLKLAHAPPNCRRHVLLRTFRQRRAPRGARVNICDPPSTPLRGGRQSGSLQKEANPSCRRNVCASPKRLCRTNRDNPRWLDVC